MVTTSSRFRKKVTKRKLVTIKQQVSNRPDGKIRRAPYFRHYRDERTALSILENCYSRRYNRKEYRANRHLYYFVIPYLARFLWWPPDRERLENVEVYFYNELLSYSFRSGRNKEPNRVPVWLTRHPVTVEYGHPSEAL